MVEHLLVRIAFTFFVWVEHLLRRARGGYRSGYAVVPDGLVPGDTVGGPGTLAHLELASDPVYLPLLGTVARVRQASGTRAHAADRGLRWTAESATVVETLPAWVGFGPDGATVMDVVREATELSPLEAGPLGVVDPAWFDTAARGDGWKVTLVAKIRSFVRAAITDDPGARLVRELPSTGGRRPEGPARPIVDATTGAAVAAALADELTTDRIAELSAAWVELVAPGADWRVRPHGRLAAARGRLRRSLDWFERHPGTALGLTLVVVFPLMIGAPAVGAALFLLVLAFAVTAALARAGGDRRRARRRRDLWPPTAARLQVMPVRRVRRALEQLSVTGHPLMERRVRAVLRGSRLWLVVRGPRPQSIESHLRWLESTGEVPAAAIIRQPSSVPAIAIMTTRSTKGAAVDRAAWGLERAPADIAEVMQRLDVGLAAIDPGRPWSVTVGVEAFCEPMAASRAGG